MSENTPFMVQPFEPPHQAGVVALAEELLCREYRVQSDLSRDEDLQDVAGSYAPPASRFLVALSEGKVVGTGGIRRLSETDCELKRLYIDVKHRRGGIASAIVATLIPFVREQGYQRILLEIRPEMVDTIHRYSRYGFSPVPEGEDLPRPGSFLAIRL